MRKLLLKTTALVACLFTIQMASADDVATFEDFNMGSATYWKGNFQTADTLFRSGSYLFSNHSEMMYGGSWAYGSEFGVSRQSSTSCSWTYNGDEYNCVSGSGVSGSAQFAVAYADNLYPCRVYMSDSVAGTSITGCYINNTAYVAEAAKGNDSYEGAFVAGDWFMLTATARKADGTTKKDSLFLIDCRSSIASEHHYISEWTWFDFSDLGNDVKYIDFTVSGTHTNDYGLLTPTYFCMDDFGAQIPAGMEETKTSETAKTVTGTSYYTTSGEQLSEPGSQISIVVTHYSDGTSSSKKVLKR